jgi:RNA polymerase sigma factor (sigma-70 family)
LLVQARETPETFATFYSTYADSIERYLVRRVLDPETAFDLLSETFAKALERQHQFRGASVEQEQGWLYAIARSELSHYWRSGKVERAAIERLAIDVPTLTDDEYDHLESLADLDALDLPLSTAFASLPVEHRQAITLRVLDELPYPEVAQALDITEANARARVSRGLRTLARALDQSTLMKDAA